MRIRYQWLGSDTLSSYVFPGSAASIVDRERRPVPARAKHGRPSERLMGISGPSLTVDRDQLALSRDLERRCRFVHATQSHRGHIYHITLPGIDIYHLSVITIL